jgi:2'-5' RNA ligase
MKEGDRKPATPRLFAALDLPDAVRAGIDAWGSRELCDPALRPVAAENLHITLCFLGWTEPSRVDEAAAAVLALAPEPVRMRLDREPVGKPACRPGVWALEADAPAAAGLQARLAGALSEAGLYEPEDRPFWAHLTVARTRNEPERRRPQHVKTRPGELPAELAEPFDAVRVSLYRSDLRSDGAKYVSLTNLNLPPSA